MVIHAKDKRELSPPKILGPITTRFAYPHFRKIFIHDISAMARTAEPSGNHFLFGLVSIGDILPVKLPGITCPANAFPAT